MGAAICVMSGVAVTTARAREVLFSTSYLDETLGLLVPDHDRERFATWRDIGDAGPITIGVPDLPYFIEKLRRTGAARDPPHASPRWTTFSNGTSTFDAVALPAERGSAWTLLYPQYSVVVPDGALVKIPLAYPIGRRDGAFAAFLNTWIELKRKDGTLDTLYNYWVLGQNATPRQPRWSIARDVLHWVE